MEYWKECVMEGLDVVFNDGYVTYVDFYPLG